MKTSRSTSAAPAASPRCCASSSSATLDVAIVATSVPDASYRDLLRALHLAREDLPAIVVGALDRDAIRDALALGALDVVTPADLARLGPAIARALREAVLVPRCAKRARELDRARRSNAAIRSPGFRSAQRSNGTRESALADCEREGNSLAVHVRRRRPLPAS